MSKPQWIETLESLPVVPGELQGPYIDRCCEALYLKPQKIVEIGVYKGQTARHFRNAFPLAKLILIDPWQYIPENKGKIYTKNNDQESWNKIYQDILDEFDENPMTYILRCGSVPGFCFIKENSVDLIFIDGDHSYEAVHNDIEVWLTRMTRPCIFAGHDYTARGMNKGVKKAVDELLGRDVHVGPRKTWVKYYEQ